MALAGVAAYAGSFRAPFLFDDDGSIAQNPTIRSLRTALFPPAGSSVTVSGRPLVNVSFAVNYAISGIEPWSYHAVNLIIHLFSAWILFCLLRVTLKSPGIGRVIAGGSDSLALSAAALWAVHPLNTEAVTYVVQRAESLVSLFYLLTLYFFARSVVRPGALRPSAIWRWSSVASCLLGMATKEVMVSAPVIVWLYDRTFVAGSFRQAFRQRKAFYLLLASSWLVLAYLVIGGSGRGGSAGFCAGVAWWAYALTQCQAVVHYIRLLLWPWPLTFDYGTSVVSGLASVPLQAALVLAAITGTLVALRRKPVVGFVGTFFFAVLAPSSSVVPIATQTIAEHRMYLAGAVALVSAVVGLHVWLGRKTVAACLLSAGIFCALTSLRNRDYRTEEAIWRDTVVKCPDNPRAHATLGLTLYQHGRYAEAIAEDQAALRLSPDYVQARSNLGSALQASGNQPAAIAEFRRVLKAAPNAAEVHYNLATALAEAGETAASLAEFDRARRLNPRSADIHSGFGDALFNAGRLTEAAEQYEAALQLAPNNAVTLQNLGTVQLHQGRTTDAIATYGKAVQLSPALAAARTNLGIALEACGRWSDATAQLEVSLQLDPTNALTYEKIGMAQANEGRYREAQQSFEASLRLRPDQPQVQQALETIRTKSSGANPGGRL